jgi:hypothetical protein
MVERYTSEYYVINDLSDGYVNHDLSNIQLYDTSLMLGWEYYYDTGDCDLFIGFENINIKKGSTIVSATLELKYWYIDGGYVETEIKANTDYSIPTSYAEFVAMTPSENFANLYQDPNTEKQIGIYDVTEIIQELVNRGDWEALNTIVFFSGNTIKETADSGCDIEAYPYDPTSTKLTITYKPPEEVTLNDVFDESRVESFEYEKLSLDSNGEYIHDSYLDNYVNPGGNISINFDRDIIGSININLHDDADFDYISDVIRPWYVITYNEIDYKFPLGTYLLFSPKRQSDGNFVERPAYGYDLLYALDQDKITASITYDEGEIVTDIIEDILDNVGSWVKYNIPSSSETLVEDASYEIGRSKLFIINSLLKKINYYPLWASGLGIFRSIPWSEVYTKSWTFEDNNKSLYLPGVLQTINYTDVYNRVIIVARQLTADTEPLYKSLTFEDIDMDDYPLSYTSIGRYITKVFYSEATSQSYVDSRAERELRKMTEIEESITYKHAFVSGRFGDGLPYQGDAFRFKNELLGISNDYKIENMKIRLDTGKVVNSKIRRVISDYE